MDKSFSGLNKAEYQFLITVPLKIAVLIAGADSIIDEKELTWAEKITSFRTKTEDYQLREFYRDVDEDFNEKVHKTIEVYEGEFESADARNLYISEELTKVNPILDKLPQEMAEKLYHSFRTLAHHIAHSSGGVLGFGALSPSEKLWVDLKMIKNPAEREK